MQRVMSMSVPLTYIQVQANGLTPCINRTCWKKEIQAVGLNAAVTADKAPIDDKHRFSFSARYRLDHGGAFAPALRSSSLVVSACRAGLENAPIASIASNLSLVANASIIL
jgi:hypothetical protein